MNDDDEPDEPTMADPLTREHVVRHLVDGLTARATPIDFAELERTGVLRKVRNAPSWYQVLDWETLPRFVRLQATAVGQRRVDGRLVMTLQFSRSTTLRAAALLAKVESAMAPPVTDLPKPARRRFPPRPVSTDTPLSARQRRFVEEYLVDLNGEAAAIRAGYSPKTARVQASQILTRLNVQAALEAGYKARQVQTEIVAAGTVREINRLAKSDIRKFYDEHGVLLPIHSLPDDLAACIASIEVVRRNLTSGDGATELVWKIKLWNKPQALELLGRHQGIFREEQPSAQEPVPAFTLPPETPGVKIH